MSEQADDRVRCGNFERGVAERRFWALEDLICPDCGAPCKGWVRMNDLCPWLKIKAHWAPAGVTPKPYGFSGQGAYPDPASDQEIDLR